MCLLDICEDIAIVMMSNKNQRIPSWQW